MSTKRSNVKIVEHSTTVNNQNIMHPKLEISPLLTSTSTSTSTLPLSLPTNALRLSDPIKKKNYSTFVLRSHSTDSPVSLPISPPAAIPSILINNERSRSMSSPSILPDQSLPIRKKINTTINPAKYKLPLWTITHFKTCPPGYLGAYFHHTYSDKNQAQTNPYDNNNVTGTVSPEVRKYKKYPL